MMFFLLCFICLSRCNIIIFFFHSLKYWRKPVPILGCQGHLHQPYDKIRICFEHKSNCCERKINNVGDQQKYETCFAFVTYTYNLLSSYGDSVIAAKMWNDMIWNWDMSENATAWLNAINEQYGQTKSK